MGKTILKLAIILVAIYAIMCTLLFFNQEKLIFFPEKIKKDFKFNFDQPFEEITIKAVDGKWLNGVLFKCDKAKGLIFYLHGNAGSLRTWGHVSELYTQLSYDVFILDYRGYGKSEGSITNQQEVFSDVQAAYNELKKRYSEDRIVVLGYSIGTGPACKLASANNPKLLLLQAPYYSLTDMMEKEYPVIPTVILKYKFEINRYIKDCKMPVVVFHGNKDEVIYYESSLKLKQHFKMQDTLITLNGQRHNGMTANEAYRKEIKRILE